MKHRTPLPSAAVRGGFTLVELLMVILIIGMLAALLSNAIWSAMQKARVTQISVELGQIATAMNQYKEARGDYPPDMRNPGNTQYQALVMRHIRRAWPRYTRTTYAQWRRDVSNNTGLDPNRMRQAEALVFWLGGIWDPNTRTLRGYNANVRAPFNRNPRQYVPAYFAFNETRVIQNPRRGNWPVYAQPRGGVDQPYVYFAASGGNYNLFGPNQYVTRRSGTAHPYLLSKERANGGVDLLGGQVYVEGKTFQVIASGLDENFGGPLGNGNFYPHGLGYTAEDEDNVASFSQGTLGDKKP